jgi:hypothetical protein
MSGQMPIIFVPGPSQRPPPVRISAAAWGLARDLRRRVEVEDGEYLAAVAGLFAPIRARQKRQPGRPIRPAAIEDSVRAWRSLPRTFRLRLDLSFPDTGTVITERRLAPGYMAVPAEGIGAEPGLSIVEMSVVFDKTGARKTSDVIALFSLHAIARRVQRGASAADADLLRDVALVALHPSDSLPAGGGVKIRTDETGGGWRGRIVNVATDTGTQRAVAVRTWLPE